MIHNPVDLDEYEAQAEIAKEMPPHHDTRIVYTGVIYDAHFSAFQNLIEALQTIGNKDIYIHLYTTGSPVDLEKKNITGPVVVHKHLPNSAMPAIQRSADILFLPLALNSLYSPEIINTSAPGKLGEYLAAKRPILVHAPKESFVAKYFKKFNCGLVVDDDDPEKLAQAIIRLLSDRELKEVLIKNAYNKAKTDFDITNARKSFFQILNY